MHLVIDIGNTLTKALVFDDGVPLGEPMSGPTGSEFILQLMDIHAGHRIAIACVAELDPDVRSVIRERGLLTVDGRTPLPIINGYASPDTLGADRICAAVGARSHFPGSTVLAIDMGTCITYELVTAQGEYLGGGISPGMRMRFRALAEFTGKLPRVEAAADFPLIGTDTASSIRSGVQNGIRLEIDGIISSHLEQYPDLRTVGTGGDLPYFERLSKRPIFADPILVLRGLHEILLHNS